MKFLPLLALFAIPTGIVGSSAQPATSCVATVDMGRLMSEHKEYLEDRKAVDLWQQEMRGMFEKKAADLMQLQEDLMQWEPDSDRYAEGVNDVEMERFHLDLMQKQVAREFDKKIVKSLSGAHQRAVAAVEEYREANGIELVIQHNSEPVRGRNGEEVVGEILLRSVVAFSPQLDITEAVLTILNDK